MKKAHLSTLLIHLGAAVASGLGAEEDTVALPKCPTWSDGIPVPVEHTDGACDTSIQNNPEKFYANEAAIKRSVATGELLKMKDERSWICPDEEGFSTDMVGRGTGVGLDGEILGPMTKWIVRNKSSSSISIALVDTNRNNFEVSAVNPKTSPAHHDVEAVLRPGEWKSLDVALGSLLHVRELLTMGDSVAPGRILLRHRPGLIPIRDRSVKSLEPPYSEDVKEMEENPEERDAKEAQRPYFSFNRKCNSLSRIFVNRTGKPIDVYWAGASNLDSSSVAAERGNICQSRFAFHLGVDVTPTEDFVHRRDSFMSEENSYLGHRFVARLTSDPSRVVDEVILDRSNVYDCPRERKVETLASATQGIGVEVSGAVDEGQDDVVKKLLTGFGAVASNLTAAYIGTLGTAAV